MKLNHCKLTTKKRRGLSSVVGALLFVVLMVATFSVLGVALDTQTETVNTSREVADAGLKKQQEQFSIDVSTNSTEFLSIKATNHGQNPLEIFTLVITNATDYENGFPTNTYEIPSDTSFIPSGFQEDVVSTLDLQMKLADVPGETVLYTYKVISSLGTIKTTSLECSFTECGAIVGGGDLIVQLFADGPTGVNTKISSIVMFVTNTADFTYDNVIPMRGFTDVPTTCNSLDLENASPFWEILSYGTPDVFIDDIGPCEFDSVSPINLGPHETTLFKWDAKMSGDINTVFEFCNRVQGEDNLGDTQFSNESCDTLTIIDPNDCGGCGPGGEGGEKLILIDDLLIRPSIFMIIPSPMGAADNSLNPTPADKVMFGVNVVNPTDSTIEVSKVIMSVFAPGANNNDKLFFVQGSGCLATNISPLGPDYSDSDWSCPGENMLLWKDRDHPVSLPPFSAETFMTEVRIDGTGIDLEGVLIQTSVFTSFGSFGKGNYQTTMTVDQSPTMSIYMSPTVDSLATSDRFAKRLDIDHSVDQTFNIVLADTDTNDQTWLDKNARFIINVPREWGFVNVTGTSGVITNSTQPSVEVFGDESTQIIGITNDYIGKYDEDTNGRRAATISFEARPPSKNVDRLYIMYVLADGEAHVDAVTPYLFSSGPLNEIVLQVNSNSTGP